MSISGWTSESLPEQSLDQWGLGRRGMAGVEGSDGGARGRVDTRQSTDLAALHEMGTAG